MDGVTSGMALTGAPISGVYVVGTNSKPDVHPSRMECYIMRKSLSVFWMIISFTAAKICRRLLVSEASVMLQSPNRQLRVTQSRIQVVITEDTY